MEILVKERASVLSGPDIAPSKPKVDPGTAPNPVKKPKVTPWTPEKPKVSPRPKA